MIYLSLFFLIGGLFIFFSATIGFLRFPDFYTRMHATGKGDTCGMLFFMIGLVLYYLFENPNLNGIIQVVKMLSILVFWFLASPTATHMILRSAFESKVKPWARYGRTIREKDDLGT